VIPVGADPVSLPRAVGGDAFEAVDRPGHGDLCWVFDLEMGVVVSPWHWASCAPKWAHTVANTSRRKL
jgi:hypothetical protein